MPVRRRVVICEQKAQAELPDWAREGALLQQQLVESGRWAQMAEAVRVYRHVGFAAIDVVGFFLHYFASGQHWSLKEFGARTTPHRAQLAALGHRQDFPTPSSVSRLLRSVQLEDVRPVGPSLLLEMTDAAAVLQHPAAATRDTFGEAWHFFDSDASVQAFRERTLPQALDLPKARRRVGDALARRGYAGRKRGELRCSRGTLQHAGTGLWVRVVLSPERADSASMLPLLLEGVEVACRLGGLPRHRAVVRADGAAGSVPWLTACQQRNVHYLTRWGHYSLLEQADVQQRLARGPWYRVTSSGSGPQREAMELGEVEQHAGPQTCDADGKHFAPVRTRMVVSRFRADVTSSVGCRKDGWLYELFATDLPADAWPAAETVNLYFGRSAEENRFAQEDREIGLDHLFSYQLPGQELACVLGLMVWNLRLTRGFTQHTPPVRLPAPEPRTVVPAQPEGAPALSTASAPSEAPLPVAVQDAAAAPDVAPAATHAEPGAEPGLTEGEARALYDELDWEPVLKRLGSLWSRAATGDALLCPEGNALPPSIVVTSPHPRGSPALRLLARAVDCRACTRRSQCATTGSRRFAKSVTIQLTAPHAARLKAHLSTRRQSGFAAAPVPAPKKTHSPRYRAPTVVCPPDETRSPGPYAPSEARLVPSEFRHAFQRTCRDVAIAVSVPPYRRMRSPHALGLALTAAERQRRRRSWSARLLENALPASVEVSVLISGTQPALAALGLSALVPPKCRRARANI